MQSGDTLTGELRDKWQMVVEYVESLFHRKPDLNAILFLIGIRELGELPEKKFSKEEKTHLMHIATCKVLSYSGYYHQNGFDPKGWPVWEVQQKLPSLSLFEQEILLRQHIVEYFETEEILTF
ncbi:MAG: hypothetical protein JNL57_04145 [Bacteroidetes bacterium]|nr:hypothetical protein [Bacteroidota bacterium]